MQVSRCNGSTKGADKTASLGFTVKEMQGGLDFWMRDKQPLATVAEPGQFPANAPAMACAC